jgi:flavin reductase (DIM6/NTAB) family NADH-FMN oxidoreductase RutF
LSAGVELDPSSLSASQRYRWLISLVIPRPIALVSTRASDGTLNVAPFSYFMGVSSDPFVIAISISQRAGRPKDTAHNIASTGEFVVNAAGEAHAAAINLAGGDWDPDVNEFAVAGLTPAASVKVAPPRVAEAAFALECRLERTIVLGTTPRQTSLVLGEVMWMHVRDEVLEDPQDGEMQLADPRRMRPLARLGRNLYSTLGTLLTMDRPRGSRPGDGDGEPPRDGA